MSWLSEQKQEKSLSCFWQRSDLNTVMRSSEDVDSMNLKVSFFHLPCSFTHCSLWGPKKGSSVRMYVSLSKWGESGLCGNSHWWKVDVRIWSQRGQFINWSILESSSCSIGSFSQMLRSDRLQFPSNCWIRYLGDDACLLTRTLRGGTTSILIFLVMQPPPWSVDAKSGDSDDDGNHRLSDKSWVGSFWADGWGCSLWACWGGFSQADWAVFSQSTEVDPDFLFSRNSCNLLRFLLLVEGDFFLTSDGFRAEAAAVTVLLESKEQENCPLVSWKLNPIFWFTSVWINSRHCVD